ncbi:MAG TPA: multidrug ABC transporter ATP-binding protein [Peptococcaceae bacterium]|nr:multidrug ABC transporter ATP-binding protein [Peptococcaceae bacterium]
MISVKNLTRTYGEFVAVDRVSFEIEKGEIVGLLGHNGAGKTTIMKMITGYLEPTSGTIEINGRAIGDQRQEIQSNIGYLPENCPVYPEMTVIDYLDYAAALQGVEENRRPALVAAAISKTELTAKAAQTISTLSRGYRQRVGVAQAILHEPGILILDEPTNGLDPAQIQHMRDLIKTLAKEATVIISTHILQEVQAICDRVIIISNGGVAVDSKLDDLRADTRLVLQTSATPENMKEIIANIKGIKEYRQTEARNEEPGYRYDITLDMDKDRHIPAASLARELHAKEWQLYALHPEVRNLETVFMETTSQGG